MDKKLKRVIGFKPNQSIPKTTENVTQNLEESKSADIDALISDYLKKANKIVGWINSHPAFKWGLMCNKIGVDKGNFQRTLKSKDPKIKVEFISKIEDFLKNYGYAK